MGKHQVNEKVSVCIVTRNRAGKLEKAVKSVLDQTYKNIELIIVNDGSTDNTSQLLEQLQEDKRVKVYNSEHNYISSKNIAYRMATGRYIANMDDDDTCTPDRIEQQLKYIKENGLDGCGCLINGFDIVGSCERDTDKILNVLNENTWGGIANVTLVFKKSLLDLFGKGEYFLPVLNEGGEDIAFWAYLLYKGAKIHTMQEALYNYRPSHSGWKCSFYKYLCKQSRKTGVRLEKLIADEYAKNIDYIKSVPEEEYIKKYKYPWQEVVQITDNLSAVITSKCACTTLAYISNQHNGISGDIHACKRRIKVPIGELFSVYRDPVERFTSFYNDKVLHGMSQWVSEEGLGGKSVDEILERVEEELKKPPIIIDQHIRRQVDTYPLEKIDTVVRIEDLDLFLCSKGVNTERKNVFSKTKVYLTDEQKSRVRELYKDDYEILNSGKVWKRTNVQKYKPRRNKEVCVCVCACIKNEHRYLKEWIDYHSVIGIDHIYLVEDYGSKSHFNIVKEYSQVTLIPMAEIGVELDTGRQLRTYQVMLERLRGEYDWCAFIDIDEFIHLQPRMTWESFHKRFQHNTGVFLSWVTHSASGQIEYEDKPVRERFTEVVERYPTCDSRKWRVKTIANLNNPATRMTSAHWAEGAVNTMGMRTEIVKCLKYAYIDHYFTKSWEEWCNRFTGRGDIVLGHRKVDEFFEVNTDMLDKKDELMKMYETWDKISKENAKP